MANDDYEVGFGKPPKSAQYKPGQSGNPKGRPKGTQNLATDIREEISQMVSINESGSHQVISKQRALVKTLVAKGLKGDTRAFTLLFHLIAEVENGEAARNVKSSSTGMAKEDQAVLDAYVEEVLAKLPKS